MSFNESFCPSPWFHMRITNSGTYEYCRWMTKDNVSRADVGHNIQQETTLQYFQNGMSPLRSELLTGGTPKGCNSCYVMEQSGKVSGRQKQLLKVGVIGKHFEKSLASSPLTSAFEYSNTHAGHTRRTVLDWQIDLGNYCNSACVFCHPESSSRMAAEFQKLGLIEQVPPTAWCDDPDRLNSFIADLVNSPDLQYLHFIGGETLITPAFETILEALITAELADKITVGFTTNLTVWSNGIVELLKKFQQVNLGMSIETLTSTNDYVRWPSQFDRTRNLLDRWVKLGKSHNWLMQLRITPTCLTVHELDTVYDYAWNNKIAVESCNFLDRPTFMRIGVLPKNILQQAKARLTTWVDNHTVENADQIVNTRDENVVHAQIYQDAQSYLNYLDTVEDETQLFPELIDYLKRLESSRGNSILTYIPQYEHLFRSKGY